MHTDRIEYHVTSGYIRVMAEGRALPAFWAHPDLGGTFPGLILLHDRDGLTAHIRRLVRRFAEVGYYVIAPDLFNKQLPTTPRHAERLVDALGNDGPSYAIATFNALTTHNKCNSDIGVVGFGIGGTLALHMAVHHAELKTAVTFYGDFTPYESSVRDANTVILGVYGDSSERVNADKQVAFQQQLEASPLAHKLVIYKGVGDNFFDETGEQYVAAAATDAWLRVLDFLDDYLSGPSDVPGFHDQPAT